MKDKYIPWCGALLAIILATVILSQVGHIAPEKKDEKFSCLRSPMTKDFGRPYAVELDGIPMYCLLKEDDEDENIIYVECRSLEKCEKK